MKATHKYQAADGHIYYGTIVRYCYNGNLVHFLLMCEDGITSMKEPVCVGVIPIQQDEQNGQN